MEYIHETSQPHFPLEHWTHRLGFSRPYSTWKISFMLFTLSLSTTTLGLKFKYYMILRALGGNFHVPWILFMPPPFSVEVWGGEGHIVSPLSVRTSVPSVHPVRNTLLVSMRYLWKGLVYWIEILYTGIYSHIM